MAKIFLYSHLDLRSLRLETSHERRFSEASTIHRSSIQIGIFSSLELGMPFAFRISLLVSG